MPNTLAYVALFGWPLVVYVLFSRLPRSAALGWTVVAGYLLLPTQAGLNLPGVPAINKDGVPILSAGLMLLFGVGAAAAGGRRQGAAGPVAGAGDATTRRGRLMITVLLTLLLASPVLTVLTNAEPMPAGPRMIPGLRAYDAGSLIAGMAITILPFLLARRYFASPESHVVLLRILVVALLGYSLLILYEVRMSPQISRMVYGFFPHSFLQHIRGGGFRPVVFLHHGLWLAILVAMSVLAAAALWRQRMAEGRQAGHWLFACLYLFAVLFLSNSLGAFALALLLLPAPLFLGVRGQLLLAGIVAGIVLLYPMLRGSGLVPVDRIYQISLSISEERAESFMFRANNEDVLLAKAAQKPLAGWGSWGRNQVYDEDTGRALTITDGAWILIIGVYGWLGYIAQFGLLTLPMILLALRRGALALTPATSGLAVVMAANLLDLLPNATLTPVTWLVAGALAGRYAYVAVERPDDGSAPADGAPRAAWIYAPTPGQAPPRRQRRAPVLSEGGYVRRPRRP